MKLFSRFLRWPHGQRRRYDLRAQLWVNGLETLEARIQPSNAAANHGADVSAVAIQIGVDHTVPPGSIVNPVARNQSGDGGGGDVANASISGLVVLDWDLSHDVSVGDGAESGIIVTLMGTDDLGNAVFIEKGIETDGSFSFANLRAGTYSLTFSAVGYATIGTASGTTSDGSNVVDGIVLTSSAVATGYNFAVTPVE